MYNFPGYTLTNGGAGVAISTAITAVQWLAGSGGAALVTRWAVTQNSSTTSAAQSARLQRKSAAATVTAGVVGTTVNAWNPAFATPNATLSTSGTGITATAEGTNTAAVTSRGFNVLNGAEVVYVPEERPIIPVSGIVGVTLGAAVSVTYNVELDVIELRGA